MWAIECDGGPCTPVSGGSGGGGGGGGSKSGSGGDKSTRHNTAVEMVALYLEYYVTQERPLFDSRFGVSASATIKVDTEYFIKGGGYHGIDGSADVALIVGDKVKGNEIWLWEVKSIKLMNAGNEWNGVDQLNGYIKAMKKDKDGNWNNGEWKAVDKGFNIPQLEGNDPLSKKNELVVESDNTRTGRPAGMPYRDGIVVYWTRGNRDKSRVNGVITVYPPGAELGANAARTIARGSDGQVDSINAPSSIAPADPQAPVNSPQVPEPVGQQDGCVAGTQGRHSAFGAVSAGIVLDAKVTHEELVVCGGLGGDPMGDGEGEGSGSFWDFLFEI
jgi:hypothetical protein